MAGRTKEIVTSTIPLAVLMTLWIAGFWWKGIHAGMSLVLIMVVGLFPVWIAIDPFKRIRELQDEEERCLRKSKESSNTCLSGEGQSSPSRNGYSARTARRDYFDPM